MTIVVESICKQCSEPFRSYKQRKTKNYFCSSQCYAEWRKTDAPMGENAPCWKGGLVEMCCDNCQAIFERDPSRISEHNFCSMKCLGKWTSINRLGSNNAGWLGGLSFLPYGSEFNEQLKKQIKDRDGWICQECGFEDIEKNGKMSVHHIDYDKMNNDEWNLISLCLSCNSKANGKREYWQSRYEYKIKEIYCVSC